MTRTRVVVVGAGPVGAIGAYRLAREGIDVVLIDANAECPSDMRASTLHPPSLGMLAELGVLAALDAQGLRAPVYHYRNRGTGEVLAFDLTELADITPFPYRLQCEQFKVARLLTKLTAESQNGRVLFSHRLLSLSQDDRGVDVTVETPLSVETYRADYVIGADGANSLVRKLLAIPFEGFTYPEKFLTLSADFPIEEAIPNLAYVNYVVDPEEWCVLLRVPEAWRVLVPATEGELDSYLISDLKKNKVFARLVGPAAAYQVETGHRTVYRVHQRVAQTYRRGRVLLAGDAAHLNNPLGGFGMNSGIHDIWNLTGKLIDIIVSAESDDLLDRYDRQRRLIMNSFVQAQTIRNKNLLNVSSSEAQASNQLEMKMMADNPERRRQYLINQSMIKSVEDSNRTE